MNSAARAKKKTPIKHGDLTIRAATDEDRVPITDVFNYYVENSFAAYPTSKLPPLFYDYIGCHREKYPFYVIETADKHVVGFGYLHPHHVADSMNRTGEVTYFLLPEAGRKGIGARLLELFAVAAPGLGIDNFVANVCSLNEESLKFHLKHGFVECGRLKRVGKKFGEDFDIVWLQKFL